MERERKSAKCDLTNRDIRFLIAVISSMSNSYAKVTFVARASECLGVHPTVLSKRLFTEADDEFDFKDEKDAAMPRKMPRIFSEIQDNTLEATAEREKLGRVAEIVKYGKETYDNILSLMDKPEVRYCRYCRFLGYNKDHYMNHNLRGGHNNDYVCPATFASDY